MDCNEGAVLRQDPTPSCPENKLASGVCEEMKGYGLCEGNYAPAMQVVFSLETVQNALSIILEN